MAPYSELVDLAQSLRREHLFVASERVEIQKLNEKVQKCVERLYQLVWISRHQRINLDRYILNSQEIGPSNRRSNLLENVTFIDAHKRLEAAESSVSQLLKALRENPKLLALFLDRAEQIKISGSTVQSVVTAVMISIFGAGLIPEDNNLTLVLLYELMHLQLPRSDQLRRLLQNGTFSRCYRAYAEAHLPAKLFLTSALRNAIVQVLMDDKLYLDIEPNNAVIRFLPEERVRHFGQEGTTEYNAKLKNYRAWTIKKLTGLAQHFLDGIKDSIFCFPSALAWIVRQMYSIILEEHKMEPKQIAVICADLIFTFFICPAIADPELYGIIEEGHVGPMARFNLVQVARIVQVLALSRYEPIDERLEEVYSNFDKECMANILEEIVQGNNTENYNELLSGNVAASAMESASPQHEGPFIRSAVLISGQELQDLVGTLHTVRDTEPEGSLLREWLLPLLERVPVLLPGTSPSNTNNFNGHNSLEESSTHIKKTLMNKMTKLRQSTSRPSSIYGHSYDSSGETMVDEGSMRGDSVNDPPAEVLVVSLPSSDRRDTPGFMPEEKVLSLEQSKRSATRVRLNLDVEKSSGSGKRTRFYPDQESIAGASDNLEAVSEAASVASSLDMEENAENDNLSDMVSANVSGPGTPSVSGRDTPSSHGAAPLPVHPAQIVEQLQMIQGQQDNHHPPGFVGHQHNHNLLPTRRARGPAGGGSQNQKQMDIEDRFGRFGISKSSGAGSSLTEEETKSMVSDTWSTDVIASDSEAVYTSEQQQNMESHLVALQQHIHGHLSQHNVQQLIDLSETASDNWSTAAMTSYSDVDRMQEIEQEDTSDDALILLERRRSADTVPEFVGEMNDRQSTPTNSGGRQLVGGGAGGVDVVEGNLIDIGEVRTKNVTPLVEIDPPQMQDELSISGGFGSISSASTVRLGGGPTFNSIPVEEEGTQSLGKLTFPMKVNSPSQENLHDSDLPHLNGVSENGLKTVGGSADSSDGNSESSCDVGDANEDERQKQMKTGAIPKTPRISFQGSSSTERSSAGRGNRSSSLSQRSGFFKKIGTIKQSFSSKVKTLDRNSGFRRGQSHHHDGGDFADNEPYSSPPTASQLMDPSDILEKYRGKNREEVSSGMAGDNGSSVSGDLLDLEESEDSSLSPEELAFLDAKRKLRIVFGSANLQTLLLDSSRCHLLLLLKMLLAESLGLQNRQLSSQLHEALRCISKMDTSMQERVLYSMREDYRQRSAYISYLVRSRQGLQNTLASLQTLLSHIERDKKSCHGYLTAIGVKECLSQIGKRKEDNCSLDALVRHFKSLTAADEKAKLVETYLDIMSKAMHNLPIWETSNCDQLRLCDTILERMVMSKVYVHALFPNGDADLHRDEVLHTHIRKLSHIITPHHKALRIPKIYLQECPWPAAQAEIMTINAYKAPRDKMDCVIHCCLTVMHLLTLAGNNFPAADDLMPVLVFVIIKANPLNLLSTIQFVDAFYKSSTEGEAGYWWTVFCGAVEFIKTIDYT